MQGTAADIIKKAMIDIQRELENKKMKTKMILQVHDELVFSVPEKEAAAARKIAVEFMEGAADLTVPVTVTVGTGENWYECG
ncbi:MAG: DNA polymerase I [Candidatus Aerophobetes bacterium ADurb.Bin490]|nr:MAG: DNA polymerase I [Candidatus Aerophobetes bacterium ADurb.Bin490]